MGKVGTVLSHNALWASISFVAGAWLAIYLSRDASRELKDEAQKLGGLVQVVDAKAKGLTEETKQVQAGTERIGALVEALQVETMAARAEAERSRREVAATRAVLKETQAALDTSRKVQDVLIHALQNARLIQGIYTDDQGRVLPKLDAVANLTPATAQGAMGSVSASGAPTPPVPPTSASSSPCPCPAPSR